MSHEHDTSGDDDHHEHEAGPLAELVTLRDWLRFAVTRFNRAGIFCGHGLIDSYDEAAYLLLHTLSLPIDRLEPFLDACITTEEREALLSIVERRADERTPAAYLTGEAWLGDFRFRVDPRVIIPRSYFAELLENGFAPWIDDPDSVGSVLDMCTGSGCLAIIMAHVFPSARVTAIDLSVDALEIATENVADYRLEDQIELVESDLFDAIPNQRFDLIISNPPYVTADAMAALPEEYRHEPSMALGAGEDGLDVVRRLIAQAPVHLTPGGVLAVEVGHNRHYVEAAFPDLELTWLSTRDGDDRIFLVTREQLVGS
ncbi:50S ribosomal protein L3 N(5)-glutamine methyltransferase [Cognatazoarcus halotolerans]|uniref:50S ribosomal protein L3 N(5)-glutamine methyltransferase n=1 Tax=Cognatazoarcus halotolerans TaxID=2686016 RepID=UPI0013585CB8|nr:50S ribosomal protein L3 N(5)-glutamine methyltransferase [Cognatazoarcus halotolerans]MCB1900190.1 50S ribosomal protein L3 N(5)-glutamine methyltransferase [Rhodocyclaceae bacterium]MCP5309019.1 50S ribosomal protein L3 N(5)-glutamine methyltransferase [Zoogloeaceae bacterium]